MTAWRGLEPAVFIPSSIIILGLILFAVVYSGQAEDAFSQLNGVITDGVGWWYVLVTTRFVAFAIYCGVTRIGTIRLGDYDAKPQFRPIAWLALSLSA